ncbi:MAG: glycyl-radical enzyme activating protein [Dehalobacterium sp.]
MFLKEIFGRISNIQRYCVHDGPGIRDVIFMKGCPLKCIWCSNPETQSLDPQIAYNPNKCILCGKCIQVCSSGALSLGENKINLNRQKCISCYKCVESCCSKALHIFGSDMAVDEVFRKIQSQSSSWRANGGVTVSGGEPLLQADFVAALLKRCRSVGIHTAIETTGFAPWKMLNQVAQWCNLIYYDVKMMNNQKHKRYTGVDNTVILHNLKKLSEHFPEIELIVRTPVIPGINDEKKDIEDIVKFLQTLSSLQDYELLPYHGYGSSKYKQLDMEYKLEGINSLAREPVSKLNQQMREMLNLHKKSEV